MDQNDQKPMSGFFDEDYEIPGVEKLEKLDEMVVESSRFEKIQDQRFELDEAALDFVARLKSVLEELDASAARIFKKMLVDATTHLHQSLSTKLMNDEEA